jgi:hypothetical protein
MSRVPQAAGELLELRARASARDPRHGSVQPGECAVEVEAASASRARGTCLGRVCGHEPFGRPSLAKRLPDALLAACDDLELIGSFTSEAVDALLSRSGDAEARG